MKQLTALFPTLVGMGAQLVAIWLALAPGLVVCLEEDGRVAIEATLGAGECRDAAPAERRPAQHLALASTVPSHCPGCDDVPLFLSSGIAAEHQHATKVATAEVASTVSTTVLAPAWLTHRQPVTLSARPPARISSQRTTILRI